MGGAGPLKDGTEDAGGLLGSPWLGEGHLVEAQLDVCHQRAQERWDCESSVGP